MNVQNLQESTFDQAYDYRAGSPHLAHWRLYDRLVDEVRRSMRAISARGLEPAVLEVGAGHGGYTEPILAAGGRVMATEMSRPSLARLEQRFSANPNFACRFDADGSLGVLGDQRFSMILCASVLHHIPDYVTFIRHALPRHLAVGGSFVSIQDPLWYPSVPSTTHYADRFAYLSWRATRGDYGKGLSTLLRRFRGVYDEENPSDMVEYHVVRQGVDHDGLVALLRTRFEDVRIETYWSTPAALWQRVGEWAGLRNTFMIVAEGYLGQGFEGPRSAS